jgi:MarR family transcriptional regulator, organic hydroperoxide resistance regulator
LRAHQAPVGFALIKATKRLQRLIAEGFAPLGVHPGQDRMLSELWAEDGLSQSELIARLGVEPPTVTGTLQKLEKAGFVRRQPDSGNRRISRVYLTDAGRALEGPVTEVLRESEKRMLLQLSPPERRELQDLLERLRP